MWEQIVDALVDRLVRVLVNVFLAVLVQVDPAAVVDGFFQGVSAIALFDVPAWESAKATPQPKRQAMIAKVI
jgi:hypothetical protein